MMIDLFPNTTYWSQRMIDSDNDADFQYYRMLADMSYEIEKEKNKIDFCVDNRTEVWYN